MAKEMTRAEHRERQRIASLLHDQLQQLLVAARLQVGLLAESSYRTQINNLLKEGAISEKNAERAIKNLSNLIEADADDEAKVHDAEDESIFKKHAYF